MYDKHLNSFFVIAEAGSFSIAADRLFISRTALIQQMNLFEKRLGFHLFKRHNKGVTLTGAGKYFYEESKKLIRITNKMLKQCRDLDEKNGETIRIGILPNFTAVFLPKICRRFTELYPKINLRFKEYLLEKYFLNFVNNYFDITTEYMSGYVFEDQGYNFVKLAEDKHCCGVFPTHPLAGKKFLSIRDLRGQKVMLYAHGITRADDKLREYIIKNVPDIELIDIHQYNSSLSLKCEVENMILIYYSMYWRSFPTLITLALDVDFPIDIGLGYKAESGAAVMNFIHLAQEMYCVK